MATLKTSVGRLYLLFDACLPQNKKVKKRLSLCRIVESDEYNQLKSYDIFKDEFNKTFTTDKLEQYDINKLDEIVRVIPLIIPTLENLCNAILYGNAPELTESDLPDFTSFESVNSLLKKLTIKSATSNTTNITKNNWISIFSDATIKDTTGLLDKIPLNKIEDVEDAIKKALINSTYCIKSAEIQSIKDTYKNTLSNISKMNTDLNKQIWSLRYKKLFCVGIALTIIAIIDSFDLLSTGCLLLLKVFSAILLVIYFFIG